MKDILYLDTVAVNGAREINVVMDRDYVMYLDYNQFYEAFEHHIDDYEDNYGKIYEPDAVLIELTSIQFNNLAINTCMNYTSSFNEKVFGPNYKVVYISEYMIIDIIKDSSYSDILKFITRTKLNLLLKVFKDEDKKVLVSLSNMINKVSADNESLTRYLKEPNSEKDYINKTHFNYSVYTTEIIAKKLGVGIEPLIDTLLLHDIMKEDDNEKIHISDDLFKYGYAVKLPVMNEDGKFNGNVEEYWTEDGANRITQLINKITKNKPSSLNENSNNDHDSFDPFDRVELKLDKNSNWSR